jgi:hypothetical protein
MSQKTKLKPLKLTKKDKITNKGNTQIIDKSNIEIIECEHFKDAWSKDQEYCMVGNSLQEMLDRMENEYNRIPDIIFHFKGNYYIHITKEENDSYREKIVYYE